jgi:hypothetical protein
MTPNFAQPRETETSPLLPKLHDNVEPIDPGGGIAPAPTNAGDREQDGGDVERQVSNGDTSKHQGLPEVRKRMKVSCILQHAVTPECADQLPQYIFPALAIGVSATPIQHLRS